MSADLRFVFSKLQWRDLYPEHFDSDDEHLLRTEYQRRFKVDGVSALKVPRSKLPSRNQASKTSRTNR